MEPVRYKLSKHHLIAFGRLKLLNTLKRGWWIALLFTSFYAVLGYWHQGFISAFVWGGLVVLVFAVTFLVFLFVLVPFVVRRTWKENHAIREEIEITMFDGGFTLVEPSSHVDQKWDRLTKWEESYEILALFPNSYLAFTLPKDQISPAHIDFARERLIATGLEKPGKRRK